MAGVNLGAPLKLALDEQEWRLIRSLREIPASPLRDRLTGLISDAVSLVTRPGCAEAQPDGVPCDDAHQACDRCGRMLGLLDGLRVRLRS